MYIEPEHHPEQEYTDKQQKIKKQRTIGQLAKQIDKKEKEIAQLQSKLDKKQKELNELLQQLRELI